MVYIHTAVHFCWKNRCILHGSGTTSLSKCIHTVVLVLIVNPGVTQEFLADNNPQKINLGVVSHCQLFVTAM